MNQGSAPVAAQVSLHPERMLALARFLRDGAGQFETTVCGGSMGSALPDGSRIRGQFANPNRLRHGQILTYVAKDRIVAHRLVRSATRYNEQYLIMRGDETVCCDIPTPASSVICVVTEICRNGEWGPVNPPETRWFGGRWTASVISLLVAALVRLHPKVAIWTAQGIIRTQRFVLRLARFAKRHMSGLFLARRPDAG